jgi:hypothetical protein
MNVARRNFLGKLGGGGGGMVGVYELDDLVEEGIFGKWEGWPVGCMVGRLGS